MTAGIERRGAQPGLSPGRTRLVLGVVGLALMAVVSAVSGLNIALPSLARQTGATQTDLTWIVDAYTVVFAGLLLFAGALGDRFGRKLLLAVGLVIFGAAAAGALLTDDPGWLIGLRALMGLGAAGIMPTTLSVITTSFPEEERPRAIGVWVGVAGGGAVLGLFASGLLLEYFEWQSFFALNVALALIALLTLFPLAWMVCASLMTPGEASTYPPPMLPRSATLANYRLLFAEHGIVRQVANSLLISLLATALSLLFNVSAGYAFAKLRFAGRERVFRLLLGALIIPAQVTMMPLFLMLKEMGLVNTYAGALVPWLASVIGIFMVRQYALTIPDELLEAARIDGAGELRIFTVVVLPVLKPIVVTLAVLTFLGSWNDFMWPLIVLTDHGVQTLPVALAALSREHVQDLELMMAGAVITVLPVLLLFLALQRYYVQGMLMGSVKG